MQGAPGTPVILDARLLSNQLQACATQADDIHSLIHEEQHARLKHWEQEEKGELEQLIASLLVSQDILVRCREMGRLHTRTHTHTHTNTSTYTHTQIGRAHV